LSPFARPTAPLGPPSGPARQHPTGARPSRFEDPQEKVGFQDDHWVRVPGGRAVAEATDEAIYLAMALKNVGSGLAVLDRWDFYPSV